MNIPATGSNTHHDKPKPKPAPKIPNVQKPKPTSAPRSKTSQGGTDVWGSITGFGGKVADAVENNVAELDKKYEEDGDLIKGWVKAEKNKDVKLYFPSIDSRRKQLLEMGYLNLNEEVEKYFKQKKILEEGLAKLKMELNLRKLPRRIDCFDISNIQGKDAVAAMTVAIDGNPDPSKYRHFKK